MSISSVYRENAQECLRIAQSAGNDCDKPLWVTMAQSWLRLAEQVEAKAHDGTLESSSFEGNAG